MPLQEKVNIGNRPLAKLNEITIQQHSEVSGKHKEKTANWTVHIVATAHVREKQTDAEEVWRCKISLSKKHKEQSRDDDTKTAQDRLSSRRGAWVGGKIIFSSRNPFCDLFHLMQLFIFYFFSKKYELWWCLLFPGKGGKDATVQSVFFGNLQLLLI